MNINIQLLILAIVNATVLFSVESQAVSLYCNPAEIKSNRIKQVKIKDSFILKSGESVEVLIQKKRGLVRSLILSVNDYRTHENKDKILYQLEIKHIEKYPKCYVIKSTSVFISRSADYTFNPLSRSDKFERSGGYLGYIKEVEGILLELLDLTKNGEAKVRVKNRPVAK